jgi:ankyrin repeat protein
MTAAPFCTRPRGPALVDLLVDRDPALLLTRSAHGRLALHAAALSFQDLEMVRRLIERNPDAVHGTVDGGLTPLHLVALHRDEESAVALARILVDRAPEVVRFRGGDGRLPIHHAAAVGPVALVEFLLERCPESIDLVTDDGSKSLHAAATRQDPSREAVVEYLVAKSPASLQVPNAFGFRPV